MGMLKPLFWIFSIALAIFFSSGVFAANNLMGMQMTSNDTTLSGDITFSIYDAISGGNLIYNETFPSNITNGQVDVMLGNEVQTLTLDYGKTYYLDTVAAGTDLTFNGADRQIFQSNIGNITSSAISPGNITSDLLNLDLNLGGLITLGNIVTNFVNTTHILDRTISSDDIADLSINATHLVSTLDVANYTAGDGITVSGHVITNINPMDYTNLALLNESWLNDTYLPSIAITDYLNSTQLNNSYMLLSAMPMDYTNIVLKNDSTTLASTWDVANYTAGDGITVSGHVITNINPMVYTNLVLSNDSSTLASTWDVTNYTVSGIGLTLLNHVLSFGNLVDRFINATHIETDAVNSTHILDRTITADDIADSAINSTHVASGNFPTKLGSGLLVIEPNSLSGDFNTSNLTINAGDLNANDRIFIDWIVENIDSARTIDIKFLIYDITSTNGGSLCYTSDNLIATETAMGKCTISQNPNSINNTVLVGYHEYHKAGTTEFSRLDIVNTGDANPLTTDFTIAIQGMYSGASTDYSNLTWIAYKYPA